MPPNPNALTPARRGPSPSQGSASVISRKRVSSMLRFGSSTWRVGGSTPWNTASAALARPAAPAAGMAWPIIDLIEPSPARVMPASAGPKTSRSVASSAESPAGVAVPCASTSPTVAGSRPETSHARRNASTWPWACGLMRLVARPSLDTPVPRMTA